jgi:hypothetical protein
MLPPIVGRGWVGEDQVCKKGWVELGNGVATSVVAGEGAINPFAKRSGGLTRANGKSHAEQCGGGGEWDNGSIDIRANMALTWANL